MDWLAISPIVLALVVGVPIAYQRRREMAPAWSLMSQAAGWAALIGAAALAGALEEARRMRGAAASEAER